MLPQLKPKKGNSSYVSSSQSLLEKNLELQNSILMRSEQKENILVSYLDRLTNTVSALERSLNQFQQNLLNNSTQALVLLTKMVKLQSGAVKAEKNTLIQLQQLNKKGDLKRSKEQPSTPDERPRLTYSEQVIINIEPEVKTKTKKIEVLEPEQPYSISLLKQDQAQHHQLQSKSESTIPKDISEFGKFGQFRDNYIVVPLDISIEGKRLGQQEPITVVKSHISHWLGYTFDSITKESFAGFSSKRMLQSETKVYLCNNIILNFYNMVGWLRGQFPSYWDSNRRDFIRLFIEGSSKSLSFQLLKYPQKEKMFISSDLQNLIPTKDDFHNPQHYIPGNLGLFFSSDRHFQSSLRSIKFFLNGIIKQAQSCLPAFKQLLKTVFTIQNGDTPHIVDHQIGIKFKENMPLYSQEEINNKGMVVKAPEILRVLIKWIEQLQEFLKNPNKILKRKFYNNSGGPPIQFDQYDLSKFVSAGSDHVLNGLESLHQSIFNSTFFSIAEYIDSHRESLDYLPINLIRTGLTVNLLSDIYSDIAVQLLDTMISLILQKINDRNYYRNFKSEDIQIIPFSIGDLLRAKCSGKLEQIRNVLDNITKNQNITLVRVKNRLETSNRDFLINFKFKGCALICELQVGLKDTVHNKQYDLDHYNHLLYELKRSKYGSISESALVIANLTQISSYFGKIVQKTSTKTNNYDAILKMAKLQLRSNTSFVCNNCMKLIKAYSSYLTSYKQKNSDVFICSLCIYKTLSPSEKAEAVLGFGTGDLLQSFVYDQKAPFPPSEFVIATNPPKDNYQKKQMYISFRHLEYERVSQRKYYHCFNHSEIFNLSDLKDFLLFKFKKELIIVTLNLDVEREKLDNKRAKLKNILADTSDAKKFSEQFIEKQVKFQLFVVKDNKLTIPSFLKKCLCAVSIQYQLAIVLDENIEKKQFQIDKKSFERKEKINKLIKSRMIHWDLSDQGFKAEEFRNYVLNVDLQRLDLENSSFPTLNFMKSESLRILKMSKNNINNIDIGDNFPNLQQLDLATNNLYTLDGLGGCPHLQKLEVSKNRIQILDLQKLNLPHLIQLDVRSNNLFQVIGQNKVFLPKLETLLIGGDLQDGNMLSNSSFSDVILPQLRTLNLSNCALKNVQISSASFPKLTILDIAYNQALAFLDLSQIDTLSVLKANRCALQEVKISKICPIKELELNQNEVELFNLEETNTLELLRIDLSNNKLKKFVVPVAQKVNSLKLKSNFLTDIIFLGPLRNLSQVDLSYNYLKTLDFSQAGSLKQLKALSIKGNILQKIIFSKDPQLTNLITINVDNNELLQDYIPSSETISSQKLPNLQEFTIGRSYNFDYFRETLSKTVDKQTTIKLIEFAKTNPIQGRVVTGKDIKDLLALKAHQDIGNGEAVFELYAKFLGVKYNHNQSAPDKLYDQNREQQKIIVFKPSDT